VHAAAEASISKILQPFTLQNEITVYMIILFAKHKDQMENCVEQTNCSLSSRFVIIVFEWKEWC
jgi:hypothetical protein